MANVVATRKQVERVIAGYESLKLSLKEIEQALKESYETLLTSRELARQVALLSPEHDVRTEAWKLFDRIVEVVGKPGGPQDAADTN